MEIVYVSRSYNIRATFVTKILKTILISTLYANFEKMWNLDEAYKIENLEFF